MPDLNEVQVRSRVLSYQGRVAQLNGDLDEAVRCLNQSLAMTPTVDAYLTLAAIQSQRGQDGQALLACWQAIELDPLDGYAWNDAGAYLLRMGKCHSAIYLFDNAVSCSNFQDKELAYFNLGRAFEMSRQPFDAIMAYQSALIENAAYAPARDGLARVYGIDR